MFSLARVNIISSMKQNKQHQQSRVWRVAGGVGCSVLESWCSLIMGCGRGCVWWEAAWASDGLSLAAPLLRSLASY